MIPREITDEYKKWSNVGGVGAEAGDAPSSGSHWSVTSNNMIQAGTKRFPPNKQLATSDKNRGVASHSSIDLEWETAEGNQPTLCADVALNLL